MERKRYAIIVAGGRGSRFGSDVPKQFQMLEGVPVLWHSLLRFREAYADISLIVVLNEDYWEDWESLQTRIGERIPHRLIKGGRERFHSVKNALASLPDSDGLVAVHDAARPLSSAALIQRAFQAAGQFGSAVPVVPVAHSLRQVGEDGSRPVRREEFRIVQTPQVFSLRKLKDAYSLPYHSSFTDDASVFEMAGGSVHLIEGEEYNLKITFPGDLLMAECLLREKYISS